ncbi:hypothetical protein ELI38_15545 [Rhizobium leguminosarum]|nr:hypothetical protein ELI38_15545 [Rhizobium leguminosarum]
MRPVSPASPGQQDDGFVSPPVPHIFQEMSGVFKPLVSRWIGHSCTTLSCFCLGMPDCRSSAGSNRPVLRRLGGIPLAEFQRSVVAEGIMLNCEDCRRLALKYGDKLEVRE